MKTAFKKHFVLILVFLLIFSVCTFFSVRKQGMFVDEIYTYGLSNGYYTPFVVSIPEGDVVGSIISAEEFSDYLTVGNDDAFAVGSVYYNQSQDVHPPLYYWLFNLASSLVRTGFTKWTGLVLDGIIYALTLFVLYKLAMLLFEKDLAADAAVLVYGLSSMGISTMLMIRMYVLLSLLSLLLAYLIARLIKKPEKALYPLIGLTVLAGLLTQYYYVFYAFFACLAYFIYALVKKNYRSLIFFTLWAFAGVGALVVVFPPFITQLFSDNLVSGSTAVDNITNSALYISRTVGFLRSVIHYMKAAVIAAAAALVLCAVFFKKLSRHDISIDALVIILPAVIALPAVAIMSPVPEMRYVYNLAPFYVLALCWLINPLCGYFRKSHLLLGMLFLCCLSLWAVRSVHPDYIYPEHAAYNAAADIHSEAPCVYFGDSEHNGPLTQDLLQLMRFEDVYLADDSMTPALLDYIDTHASNSELVIYISTSKDWGSNYDPDEIIALIEDSTDYSEAELLYAYGLSETYLLTK